MAPETKATVDAITPKTPEQTVLDNFKAIEGNFAKEERCRQELQDQFQCNPKLKQTLSNYLLSKVEAKGGDQDSNHALKLFQKLFPEEAQRLNESSINQNLNNISQALNKPGTKQAILDMENTLGGKYGASISKFQGPEKQIAIIQTAMSIVGVQGIQVNGKLDNFINSVRHFQQIQGTIKVDGIIGSEMITSLNQALISKMDGKALLEGKAKSFDKHLASGEVFRQHYENLLTGLKNRIKGINTSIHENTTMVGKIGDMLSSDGGGKAIYETQMKNALLEAQKQYSKFKQEASQVGLENQNGMKFLDQEFQNILRNGKIEDISVLEMAKNSGKNLGDDVKHAGLAVEGIAIGSWETVKGLAQLAELLAMLAFDSNTREAIGSKLGEFVFEANREGWGKTAQEILSKILTSIQNEWDRIKSLPADEQAKAIGEITGKTVAGMGLGKAGAIMGKLEKVPGIGKCLKMAKTVGNTEVGVAGKFVTEKLGNAVAKVIEAVPANIREKVSEGLIRIQEKASEFVKSGKTVTNEMFDTWFGEVKAMFPDKAELKQTIKDLYESMKDKVVNKKDEILNKLSISGEFINTQIEKLKIGLQLAPEQIRDKLGQYINTLNSQLQVLSQGANNIMNNVQQTIQQIQTIIADFPALKDKFNKVLENIKEKLGLKGNEKIVYNNSEFLKAQKLYRSMLQKLHPDKNSNHENLAKQINNLYDRLKRANNVKDANSVSQLTREMETYYNRFIRVSDEALKNGEILVGQKFKIGAEVKIPRSDGSVSIGQVTGYDETNQLYHVSFRQNGRWYIKDVMEEDLNRLNAPVEEVKQIGRIESDINHGTAVNEKSIEGLSSTEKLHFSKFSDDVPESLRKENPIAWINKEGQISYNKSKLEQKFQVKITGEQGETLFDGKSLKQYMKDQPEKGKALMEDLKNLKGHESTHRLLESHGIKGVGVKMPDGTTRAFSQEEICHIVDGSRQVKEQEFSLLENELKSKLGADFKLEGSSIRKDDAKNIAEKKGEGFTREREAAKDDLSPDKKVEIIIAELKTLGTAPKEIMTKIQEIGFENISLQTKDKLLGQIRRTGNFWEIFSENRELASLITERNIAVNYKLFEQATSIEQLDAIKIFAEKGLSGDMKNGYELARAKLISKTENYDLSGESQSVRDQVAELRADLGNKVDLEQAKKIFLSDNPRVNGHELLEGFNYLIKEGKNFNELVKVILKKDPNFFDHKEITDFLKSLDSDSKVKELVDNNEFRKKWGDFILGKTKESEIVMKYNKKARPGIEDSLTDLDDDLFEEAKKELLEYRKSVGLTNLPTELKNGFGRFGIEI